MWYFNWNSTFTTMNVTLSLIYRCPIIVVWDFRKLRITNELIFCLCIIEWIKHPLKLDLRYLHEYTIDVNLLEDLHKINMSKKMHSKVEFKCIIFLEYRWSSNNSYHNMGFNVSMHGVFQIGWFWLLLVFFDHIKKNRLQCPELIFFNQWFLFSQISGNTNVWQISKKVILKQQH